MRHGTGRCPGKALQQIGEPARERIAKVVIARVSTYEEDGKVRIPGVARCIVGTK